VCCCALPQIDDKHSIFQLDVAPPHYSVIVHEWLNEHFLEQWIGGGSYKTSPSQSRDLAVVDISFWGYVKQVAYTGNSMVAI
jgi:hypothetical protein